MNNDTLKEYGHGFQIKTIAALFDMQFCNRIFDIMSPKYFSSPALEWIVTTFLKNYEVHKVAPTIDVFKIAMLNHVPAFKEAQKTSIIEELKQIFSAMESKDLPNVKEEALSFCQNQSMKNALLKSVDLLKIRKYESIRTIISDALKAGMDRDIGRLYKEMVDQRFDEAARFTIPTPWDPINEITGGGFAKGELIVFVAGPGAGKSMSLVNVAAHALKNGKTVFYYTLELNAAYVEQRFDSYFTGIPVTDLQFHRDEVTAKVRSLKGNLVTKYYPNKTATLSMIEAHAEKAIALGHKPDMIVIDYADEMDYSSGKNARNDSELKNLYSDMRGLAGRLEIPVFTASQVNREGAKDEVIEGDKIAESYAKLMVADFVISLSRKLNDKLAGTGRWHIIKNRFGPDGQTFPSKIDMNSCKMNIYESTSLQGQSVQKDMQNSDTLVKKELASRYKSLMSTTN